MVALVSGMSPLDRVAGSGLLCSACGFLLIRPKQTICGHRYCCECMTSMLQKSGAAECCVCREKIQASQVFPDKAAEKDVSGMEIQCPKCSSGCTWRGLLRDYLSSHERECEHAVEPCTNATFGCAFSGERRALQHHESHVCDWRLVYCQHCSCSLPHSLLEDHLSNCPKNKPKNTPEILPRGTGAEEEPQPEDKSSCQSERHHSSKKPQSLVDEICSPAHLLRLLSVTSSLQTRLDRGEEVNVAFKKLVMSKLLAMQSLLSTKQGEREGDAQTPREEIATLTQDLAVCRGALAELQSRCLGYERALQHLQSRGGATASENGTLVWKIKGFSASLREPERSVALSLHSPAFLSHPFGYRLCLRLYPRGDGVGRGSHASLFLCVMRGEWDDVLPWPFRHKVTFSCLDSSGGGSDVREAFLPDPLSASFQKPRAAVNVASGCPLFIRHSLLLAPHNPYLRNDTLYIKAVIETH
ncbi:TNF receptor-associated factor 2-like [Polyodon spathula]|uniref:TNF receptor-associated factor 2-like n=1 Tax=Polyodon spathula TaxID=7913 RepID=UPI001B7F2123|nr:TNF receptor-associated factor 2-like [Polyodon spathula]